MGIGNPFKSITRIVDRTIGRLAGSAKRGLDKYGQTAIKAGAVAIAYPAASYAVGQASGATTWSANQTAAATGVAPTTGTTSVPTGLATSTTTANATNAGLTAGAAETTAAAKTAAALKTAGNVVKYGSAALQGIGILQQAQASKDLENILAGDQAAINAMMQSDQTVAIPTPSDQAVQAARKRSLAAQQRRRGRSASILSDPSRSPLG